MITELGDSISTGLPGGNHGLRIERYSTDQEAIVRHKVIVHSYVFSFPLEGTKAIHTRHGRIVIGQDHFLLISPGHYLMSEKIASPAGLFRTILFLMSERSVSGFFTKHPQLVSAPHGSIEPVHVFEKTPFIQNLLSSLGLMLDESEELLPEMSQVKQEELLLYLCHHFPHQMSGLRQMALADDADFKIRKIAEANIESNVTLEELSFLCNMSLSTFKRKFTRLYGMPPAKWFLQKKMEFAGALLRSGKEKPSEVFHRVGYESHSSFAHSFKHIFGLTPTEYRENAMK